MQATVRSPSGYWSNDIEQYNLAETGPDTGVFTGELTLVGTELRGRRQHQMSQARPTGRRRTYRRHHRRRTTETDLASPSSTLILNPRWWPLR